MRESRRVLIMIALLAILPACQGNGSPGVAGNASTQPGSSPAKIAAAPATTAALTPRELIAAGKNVARRCAACHNFDSSPKVGPGLAGIFGRKAGSMPGYAYRFTAYIAPGKAWPWDAAHLGKWVCNSAQAVREFTGDDAAITAMPVQHLCDPVVQSELIAYLKKL